MNPYKELDDYHFWRRTISQQPKHLLDPVVKSKIKILKNDKIGTAGSCFAQHISRELFKQKFHYLVTEKNPNISVEEKKKRNYGVFSARYGNIYTVRQLLQLFEETQGNLSPRHIIWNRADGKFIDALRPTIEPDGFNSKKELLDSRTVHLHCVKKLLNQMDIFIFTLGLTEAWRSIEDGTVYPLAPGVIGGKYDPCYVEFINFKITEVINDLSKALDLLKSINPKIKVILTVSPVPLIATYEKKHVLVSNTYSKSVLRVAASEVEQGREWVEYFPSYEIITGNYSRSSYFENDLRGVNAVGVSHVMRLFIRHYTEMTQTIEKNKKITHLDNTIESEQQLESVICDEEQIDKMKLECKP